MDTEIQEGRSKRKKVGKQGRLAAFSKLKELKGSKHKYEVSEINNVYETVDEKEYVKEVLSRQDDWIVNDDGNGYTEDGRDIFDDDLDSKSMSADCLKGKKGFSKKKQIISDHFGKGNLQYMLSSMPIKKKEDLNLEEDDILSEIIQEIDVNKSESNNECNTKKKTPAVTSVLNEKQIAKNYMKSFVVSKPLRSSNIDKNKNAEPIISKHKSEIFNPENILKDIKQQTGSVDVQQELFDNSSEIIKLVDEFHQNTSEFVDEIHQNASEFKNEYNVLEDDFDMAQIQTDETSLYQGEHKDDISEEQLFNGWNTMQHGTCNDEIKNCIKFESSNVPLTTNSEGKKVFRFFWWDAFEDRKCQPGIVLLFGKTYHEYYKSYVSCCVAVRNIQRKIYLLPRTNFKNDSSKTVTLLDVYREFNDNIATYLQLDSFKSRKVTKNYVFDPEIPTESEYLEVRYSAKSPIISDEKCSGETYSRILGLNTSYLEIFLLECKIKGPCWLDITNAESVINPVSWCKVEVNCMKTTDVCITNLPMPLPSPPLVLAAINMRTIVGNDNKFGTKNEIVMITVLVHTNYLVEKQPPNPPFQQHFCVLARPDNSMLPIDIHEAFLKYKGTKVQKMDSERGLLNYFINQFSIIDPDLVVGHDLQGYQIDLLCQRLRQCGIHSFSKLSRLKRNDMPIKGRFEREIMSGRLVCDVKSCAKELIKSRSFDLATLCQTVLKLSESQHIYLEPEEIPRMYENSSDLLKLITLTMQDTAYILKIMFELNVIPLALQITNIAGNVMSRTLMGGRSERIEYLLLHAFFEKGYLVPNKEYEKKHKPEELVILKRKKPTYSGGLVLDPKVGFYDKLILVMDFNSLYPSIIQEYNVCYTTFSYGATESDVILPDKNIPPGILPTEIRKLVESRREVKKLMNNPEISADLYKQYHIRQMALKLTANSMYGCLGFSHSRFFAKQLAAFITQKGREILINTKDLVEKMSFEVIYGDTDSIMVNTTCLDYEQVFKIGNKIKQEVNKLYKQIELDIDGVFKYLLLLKKKKYAAVSLTKSKSGIIKMSQEYKGLDIVRRDWSALSAEAGKVVLNYILSDQSNEERLDNIQSHLTKLKEDLQANCIPLSLLVITKQLTKNPKEYSDKNTLPHVQVALRYNTKGGKQLQSGDTVHYIICDDGTHGSATQRAYHIEEYKNSSTLKIDIGYYLSQQIHPVITRLCEPIEGIDAYQIASWLGIDASSYKKVNHPVETADMDFSYELRYRNCESFKFYCYSCKIENQITSPWIRGNLFLEKCANNDCKVRPIEYIPIIQNFLILQIRSYMEKFYLFEMTCEDPTCNNDSNYISLCFVGKYPICNTCRQGVMYLKYSAKDLHIQLTYFQNLFDINKHGKGQHIDSLMESGYFSLKEVVNQALRQSGFNMINMNKMMTPFMLKKNVTENKQENKTNDLENQIFNEDTLL